jgi:hypothetical protein
LLFWLGSVEFETPFGLFVLTSSPTVHLNRRRLATDEEVKQVWTFLEWNLTYAAPHELRPLYELYTELTSDLVNGPNDEPHLSEVLHAIDIALWTKQLYFHFVEPFDPLPEIEWEPLPLEKLKPQGPPAQSPSEIWGRKKDVDTFIGVRLQDQNGDPVAGSRIRIKLPDGTTKEGKTDADGEYIITGLTVEGDAEISLLDHCKPGKAEAVEWPKAKEFKVTVVDEIGDPVPKVWLWFRHGTASNCVFRKHSGSDSDGTRAPIPMTSGH